jgi:hypothetical protein
MTQQLCALLTLLFSLSGPAMGEYNDFRQSSNAAETTGVIKYSARAGGEMGAGSQAALDEALRSPVLQNVTLRTQPVYSPTLDTFGGCYAGDYDNYWIQIGNKAFINESELLGTVVHDETHLRIFERQLSDGARALGLDAAAEEAYVRQVEYRFLRMKGLLGN